MLLIALLLMLAPPDEQAAARKSLLSSLDPESLTQHMAFYELYSQTPEGKQALSHAWKLLSPEAEDPHFSLPLFDIQAIISLVTRQPFDPPVKLNEAQLNTIEKLANSLGNRPLKGHLAWTKEEVLALPSEEIDLGRGLLIEQFSDRENLKEDIRQYEASLDLMALQIKAKLPKAASPIDKVYAINRYIFQEMQFRFPPHSLYAKDIDLYTFLPSVLDSRQGVCLGVSILYLCLAQRLNLPLEIITPPGHIYVRYHDDKELINIETTARGINPPSETYLGINTRKLQERNLKEVIGMAFVNQASVYWSQQDYITTVKLYEKALPYLPDDPLLKLFLGLNYLFTGQTQKGKALLKPLRDYTFDYAVAPETLATDYLNGHIDIKGLQAIFLPVDHSRESIVKKQQELRDVLKKYPRFRAGIMQLAVTYLQLARTKEALQILLDCHALDPHDPTTAYYLAVVCLDRLDYPKAWDFLKEAESLAKARDHHPKALKELHHQLRLLSPES